MKTKGLIGKSLRFGRKWARKTVWTWIGFFVVAFIAMGIASMWQNSYIETNPNYNPNGLDELVNQNGFTLDTFTQLYSTSQEYRVTPGQSIPHTIAQVVSQVLSLIFMICMVLGSIQVVYKNELTFKDFFRNGNFMVVVKYVSAYIMYSIGVLVGFILLVFPGIWIAIKWKYFDIGVLKDGLGPIDALKNSYRITKGNRWRVFGLQIMQGLIQIPGALALGIGLLWTVPTAHIADVKSYKILNGEDDDQTVGVEEEVADEQEGGVEENDESSDQ